MNYDIRAAQKAEEFDAVYQLRAKIFIQEQGIPAHLDDDGKDAVSTHVIALDEESKVIATGRLSPDEEEKQGSISRIAVLETHRGQGLGKKIVIKLEEIARRLGYSKIDLTPHAHLETFYGGLGFYKVPADIEQVGEHPLILMEKQLES